MVAVQESEVHLLDHIIPPQQQPPARRIPTATTSFRPHWPGSGSLDQVNDENEDFQVWSTDVSPHTWQLQRGDSFTFVFKQAGVHYFKQAIVEELDQSIGDIKSTIADRQRVLLLQIEDHLLEFEEQLLQLTITLSTIDALISLGTLAVEQQLVRPEITEDDSILIKGGRHLLQELTVDNFVPNDTFLSRAKNVALISGPNTSGKSVYLKQVALIVYLAHIGSFVPCERARICLTDRIMTRIASTETVSAPQSAFALDLQQVSKMLTSRTSRTLCLIDEFGKGTMPVDGIALLAATVKNFTQLGGMAMFALHFTEILHDAVLSSETLDHISCFRMETLETVHSASGGDGSALDLDYQERTALFKLRKGVAVSSEGIPCARSAGVMESVLQRAMQVKKDVLSSQPIHADAARKNKVLQNVQHVQLLASFLHVKDWANSSTDPTLQELKKLL